MVSQIITFMDIRILYGRAEIRNFSSSVENFITFIVVFYYIYCGYYIYG